jgi:hypothetical protein
MRKEEICIPQPRFLGGKAFLSWKEWVRADDLVELASVAGVLTFRFKDPFGPGYISADDCDLLVNGYLHLQTLVGAKDFGEHHVTLNDARLLVEAISMATYRSKSGLAPLLFLLVTRRIERKTDLGLLRVPAML